MTCNLGASSPSTLPTTLPAHCYVEDNKLHSGTWKNSLLRFFAPSYASSQDKKVSQFFIQFFKEFSENEPLAADKEKAKAMLSLAEQHVARGKSWSIVQSQDTSSLERYALAARKSLNLFEPGSSYELLKEKCRVDNKSLLDKWNKLGFSEEAFWNCPDLVDFVFKSFIHRHITHPHYNHTIEMRLVIVRKDGQVTMEYQPHLFVDGRMTSWTDIRKKIKLDQDQRLYSIENGQKKYWMYLEKGLTQWDRHNLDHPHRLHRLDRPPLRSRVEIITSHAHKEDWDLRDRLLKGTRHSFFRVIPGEGYSSRHPHAGLEDGSVYSFGWSTKWTDFSFFNPLSTYRGRWFCPDNFEFYKEDLCITAVDVTEEQLTHLVDTVKKQSREENPFHIVTANCSGTTVDVLKEAGIVNICTKNHMTNMLYKFLLPKAVRNLIDKIAIFVKWATPTFIADGVRPITAFISSVIFAPIFSLFGAWRTTLSYEDEKGNPLSKDVIRAKTVNRIKALFSNVFDLFSPSKMQFDLTKNIYKWQKKQPQTYMQNDSKVGR